MWEGVNAGSQVGILRGLSLVLPGKVLVGVRYFGKIQIWTLQT
jgi:hypothetical protein